MRKLTVRQKEIARLGAQQISVAIIGAIEKAIGYDKTMRLFLEIGKSIPKPFKITKRRAKAQINRLKQDAEFCKRYLRGGRKELREMRLLHEVAYA
jgi:hypothetical protein